MSQPTYKRRQILVDAELQLGMSVNMVGWLYFYVVGFALVANASSIWAVLTEPETESAYYDAAQRMQWFAQYTVVPLALTFVCVAAHSLIFTHRVAGPIYRIRTVLHEMAQRNLPRSPVTLRPKDYFKDVVGELNAVIDAFREDAGRQRRMNQETSAAMTELVAAIEAGRAKNEVMALAHKALDGAERLDRHLSAIDGSASAPASGPEAPAAVATAPADATSVTA